MQGKALTLEFYCLKGANCICLDHEFYESITAFFYESRMISERVRFDRISVLTLRIRTDKSKQCRPRSDTVEHI